MYIRLGCGSPEGEAHEISWSGNGQVRLVSRLGVSLGLASSWKMRTGREYRKCKMVLCRHLYWWEYSSPRNHEWPDNHDSLVLWCGDASGGSYQGFLEISDCVRRRDGGLSLL